MSAYIAITFSVLAMLISAVAAFWNYDRSPIHWFEFSIDQEKAIYGTGSRKGARDYARALENGGFTVQYALLPKEQWDITHIASREGRTFRLASH
jgi:hypothetical protein